MQSVSLNIARPAFRSVRMTRGAFVPLFGLIRRASSSAADVDPVISFTRNVGISAHIDSGKTTLTERILFYTKRISEINEVKGKSGVGATMDFMDLEREKGITIQSAATYCSWGEHNINIIDTPGHVDFTIEVERALRVLDGAIMVLCGVSGVQSQTLTVDKQMRRYNVPRLSFVNKCDRMGANPMRIAQQIKDKLKINAAPVQIPIGLEDQHEGMVDLVQMDAIYFDKEDFGAKPRRAPIPEELVEEAKKRRVQLMDAVADVDDALAEMVLNDKQPTVAELKAAIRRATLSLKFTPVFLGSAFKNKGVQPLLDGVVDYLPNPTEVKNTALDMSNNEAKVDLTCDSRKPFVGLAFKLEERPYGTLTYVRVYQGKLRKGDYIFNQRNMDRSKVPRLVRMHANSMEDVPEVGAGQICATFGMECVSGDTFTNSKDLKLTMTSMHVPEPVMSLAVAPKDRNNAAQFTKGVTRFTREDPTLRVGFDADTKETIMRGMGELHLEIYLERLLREYNVPTTVGQPRVAYTETISQKAKFDYLHKKQSGGSGQYGRVMGYIEPLPEGSAMSFEFVDATIGNNIPPGFKPAIEKGFKEAIEKGPLTGHPILGTRVVLEDGAAHVVDSNEQAFRAAALGGFKQAFANAMGLIREPIMKVEISVPAEFQGAVIGGINQRRGLIVDTNATADSCTILAHVPLANMFGYSTALRSSTQGKGEFSMEYLTHEPVTGDVQKKLVDAYQRANRE